MYITRISKQDWLTTLQLAQIEYPHIAAMTTPAKDIARGSLAKCFIWDDWQVCSGGYALSKGGELIGLYSLCKGSGKLLVAHAIQMGACKLNCAGVRLRDYYSKLGFVVYKEEAPTGDYTESLYYMELEKSYEY